MTNIQEAMLVEEQRHITVRQIRSELVVVVRSFFRKALTDVIR